MVGSGGEQSPEEIRRLVAVAAVQHRPVAAWYAGMHRLLCTHVVGYNEPGEWRVFCYPYGGETKSGPLPGGDEGIWRCFSLIQLCGVELLESPWRTEPHAPQHGVENIEVDRRRLSWR